jgi:NADH-quinone oxidoreductase subunit L
VVDYFAASLAISGIPPFSGFFSKDEILLIAFESNFTLWAIASLASIMTAFYMFRLLYLTFFKEFRGTEEQKHHLHESPSLITIPLIILAVLATFGGLISLPGNSWLHEFLAPVLPAVINEEHAFGPTEYMLMAIAVIGGLVGIGIAFFKYMKQNQVPNEDAQIVGFSKVLYNKYYVDEFYEFIIVKPINALSNLFRDSLETALSGIVFGFGKATEALGTKGKLLQTGSIGFYLFAFVLGVCAILTCLFLAK